MLNSKIDADETSGYTQGIQAKVMINIINNIIGNWNYFNSNPTFANNSILISYLLRLSSQKSWLGTTCSYFSSVFSTQKFPVLSNLPYTGGLVIENFILGFNMINKKFITDVMKLGEFSAIKLNTPFLNTKIYNRYIQSSRCPIVIKSLSYFNATTSEYNKFTIGRYGNQVSFGSFTYGMQPVLNKKLEIPDASTYLFSTLAVYPKIDIEYYYYNGANWVLVTPLAISAAYKCCAAREWPEISRCALWRALTLETPESKTLGNQRDTVNSGAMRSLICAKDASLL
jgi:hypothetical protein